MALSEKEVYPHPLVPTSGITMREHVAALALPAALTFAVQEYAGEDEVADYAAALALDAADALIAKLEEDPV